MNKNDIFTAIINGIIEQDEDVVNDMVKEALKEEISPMDILNKGLSAGLNELGDLFAEEEVFLPELLCAADIAMSVMDDLKEKIEGGAEEMAHCGKVVMATVEGDVHDIGKNLVCMILSASGYEVIDAGRDVKNTDLIELVKKEEPDIVGLSALITTTMPAQKEFIEMAKEEGIRDSFKVMVGGAPVTQDWADQIGADGYSYDASSFVVLADKLIGVER